jgi:diguanylate cyclase (GGDEF)-like protein
MRTTIVSWRDEPTQYDIEALRANTERVGLVIRVRWAIVAALAVFSVIGASIYARDVPFGLFVENMRIPGIALIFVLAYNAAYQMTYRRVGNIAFLNQAQLVFDMVVASVLVYYSGGVYSWFSTMYLLFILEAAFILPRRADVWTLAGIAAVLYGLVLGLDYAGVIPHVPMPFIDNSLYHNSTYVLVRYLWEVTMFGGTVTVGTLMMGAISRREQELRATSFVDEITGLFNRPYFNRVLVTEIERARRDGRELGLVIADIYHFGEVNRVFGLDVGDAILAGLGTTLREVAHAELDGARETNVSCRVGGEELAVIVPEISRADDAVASVRERTLAIAEEFRSRVEATIINGLTVTVSVGVAVFPRDGDTPDALVDAADRALFAAEQAGGNKVACVPDEDGNAECAPMAGRGA